MIHSRVILATILVAILLSALLSGCGASTYQAKDVNEWIRMTRELDGSGCAYVRGNARPYADVSFLTVGAWGKRAPTYEACLEAIPPDARRLLGP